MSGPTVMRLPAIVSDRAQIVLLFYKPGNTDPFLNKLVAYFDPPYSHVEMAFPERYGEEPWYSSMDVYTCVLVLSCSRGLTLLCV